MRFRQFLTQTPFTMTISHLWTCCFTPESLQSRSAGRGLPHNHTATPFTSHVQQWHWLNVKASKFPITGAKQTLIHEYTDVFCHPRMHTLGMIYKIILTSFEANTGFLLRRSFWINFRSRSSRSYLDCLGRKAKRTERRISIRQEISGEGEMWCVHEVLGC